MFSVVRQAVRARAALPLRATRTPLYRTVVTTRFSADHESITFDDATGIATIGISEYAERSIGDVVFVELPTEGTDISKGTSIGSVESVKAASDIYAPVSGKITAVNQQLVTEPGLVNKSPGDKGWLCKIQVSNPKEFDELMTPEAYAKVCEH